MGLRWAAAPSEACGRIKMLLSAAPPASRTDADKERRRLRHPHAAGAGGPTLVCGFLNLLFSDSLHFLKERKIHLSVFLLNNKNSYLTILVTLNRGRNYEHFVIFLFVKIKK